MILQRLQLHDVYADVCVRWRQVHDVYTDGFVRCGIQCQLEDSKPVASISSTIGRAICAVQASILHWIARLAARLRKRLLKALERILGVLDGCSE